MAQLREQQQNVISKGKEKLKVAVMQCLYAAFAYKATPSVKYALHDFVEEETLPLFAVSLGIFGANQSLPEEKQLRNDIIKELHKRNQLVTRVGSGEVVRKRYSMVEVANILVKELEKVLGHYGVAVSLIPEDTEIRDNSLGAYADAYSQWFVEAMERSDHKTTIITRALEEAEQELHKQEEIFANGQSE